MGYTAKETLLGQYISFTQGLGDKLKQDNHKIGVRFEEMAARYLQEKGYTILRRNYRSPYGEIDIIARQNEVLVFVEIKYRSSGQYGNPPEAVDWIKKRRISKTALYFYTHHGYEEQVPCRFDVISFYGKGSMEHMENAFDYQE